MTPERWQKIEEVYHAALEVDPEQRLAYVREACAGDSDLRRDVDSLLVHGSAGEFLGSPPVAVAAGLMTGETTLTSLVEKQLGSYKILSLLGTGGMGVVYRAMDTRLQRTVAIKVLPAKYGDRFEREARAIAALNHPHICTLHDIGPDYLVMELLEGETLRACLQRGPLDTDKVLRYGAEIAEALAEAHHHGIVHRDLKPGNIMVTRNGLKVLDFGLAKIVSDESMTQSNVIMGTPAYMAPEQVLGSVVGPPADLFAFGLVLYEMVSGKPPLPGGSLGSSLASGAPIKIPPLARAGQLLPKNLDRLVNRLLECDPSKRPNSAGEVRSELSRLAAPESGLAWRAFLRPAWMVPAALLVLAFFTAWFWEYKQIQNRRWASEEAVPQFEKLIADQKPLAAFQVVSQARHYLPDDPHLRQIEVDSTRSVSVNSEPAGAAIEIQDYLSPDSSWYRLGTTPVKQARIPDGYFRWKISKAGFGQFIAAPPINNSMQFDLKPPPEANSGMVRVGGGPWLQLIDFIGWRRFQLPPFYIDKFEVSNRQYQEFVDKGGYQNREYWKENFVRDGKELSWDQAMDLFRDPTGRPGPATWEGGHFPPGQADYPVSGLSWYEAAAYVAFAGKALPAVPQWYEAAPPDVARYSIHQGNFSANGPMPVGSSQEVGPYGTYDMSGNVREWCLNEAEEGRRFILGGAWRTQTYLAFDPEALSPFDRSSLNGFRAVKNLEALPAAVAAPLIRKSRDFSQAKPASDQTFQIYRAMYAYDRRPLNALSDGIVEETPDWTKEKITIDAGYEDERLPMFLYLPKNVRLPYQTAVFFPSARVNFMRDSQNLGDLQFVDYIIKSGRALIYPISLLSKLAFERRR